MPREDHIEAIVEVEILPHGKGIELPHFATHGSAGADVRAAVDTPVVLEPSAVDLIPTGLRVAVPIGYELQVRPRSGLALRKGITVPNAPGTIDSDYRGEVKIILMNMGKEPFVIERGDRIAQLVLARVDQFAWRTVEQLDETPRGDGGFGSTGTS